MKSEAIKNLDFSTDPAIAKKRANSYDTAVGFFEQEADKKREQILNTPNTEEFYAITGTKYYVSVDGDDNNDGLSPKSPIKSLDKIEALELCYGDAILFKRGDTFRFGRTLNAVSGVTYGSFGVGPKPKIYGSPENYAENDTWQEVAPNIWKIDFPYPNANGLVIDHSRIVGVLKLATEKMRENGDYFHDVENNVFYLYLDEGKPNEVLTDIEIMPSFTLLHGPKGSKDLIIDNLCLKYTAAFAFSTSLFKGNLQFTNCESGFVGGKWVRGIGGNRYGNAVEFWLGAEDVKIENNWFYQTYDSAVSWQGNLSGFAYKNISFSKNLFEYNNCDIEFFSRGGPLHNFVMADNIMRFTSMGWGSRTFDGGYRGIEGCIRACTDNRQEPMDVKENYFTNNILDCPARQTINWNIIPHQREEIHASGTKLYIKGKYRTLIPCLQGLQYDLETEAHDRRFACNYEELVKEFPRFEEGADIYWED